MKEKINFNKENKPIFRPFRSGEIIKSKADSSKAKRELGWRLKYSLEKGLKKTVEWFKVSFLGF